MYIKKGVGLFIIGTNFVRESDEAIFKNKHTLCLIRVNAILYRYNFWANVFFCLDWIVVSKTPHYEEKGKRI